jgi:hypothetical protein
MSKEAISRKRTDQFTFRSTRVVGDTASAVYLVILTLEIDGRVQLRRFEETATVLHGGGVWRISLVHSGSGQV